MVNTVEYRYLAARIQSSSRDGNMTTILWNESKQLRKSAVVIVSVFGVFSIMYFSVFQDMGRQAQELEEAFPEGLMDFFGVESITTIEGFIAAEIYSFFWVLLVGIYFSYIGAGMIAGDIETRQLDLTLSTPVSRESVVVQKLAALWVPLTVLNSGVFMIVSVGAELIGESFNLISLSMVHILSIPYFLVCAGIGLVLSVVIDRTRTAQGAALGLIFMLWLLESVSNLDPDYEWIGYFSPNRYYNETAILVREEYAVFDAAILLLAFVLLLLVSVGIFTKRDI